MELKIKNKKGVGEIQVPIKPLTRRGMETGCVGSLNVRRYRSDKLDDGSYVGEKAEDRNVCESTAQQPFRKQVSIATRAIAV